MSPAVLAIVACLFLSGAGSLMLQVVWSRSLRLVFGSSTLAVSTVLVAYMLGLGFGGLWGGRLAPRLRGAVRVYGLMEVGIGLYALFVPWLLGLYPELNRFVTGNLDFWPAASLRLVLALAALLIPTWLMGATLPVLVSAVASRPGEIGRRVGLLYGVNTLGAVTGVLLATFALFPAIGLWNTNAVGAAADLIAGGIAIFLLARRLDTRPRADLTRESAPTSTGPSRLSWNLPLASYGLVGFSALLFEVCWTRALTLVFGSSVYAFASMLAAFLVGIALGSLLVRRWLDRLESPLLWYVYGLVALSLLTVLTTWLLPRLPDLLLGLFLRWGVTGGNVIVANLLLSIAAMLGPTIVLGALFPLLVRCIADSHGAALAVGRVYFYNTVGSALGALAAGFLLIPTIGLAGAMMAGSLLVLLGAALALVPFGLRLDRRAAVAAVILAAAALFIVLRPAPLETRSLTRGVYLHPGPSLSLGVELELLEGVDTDERVVYYRDGVDATVSVHEAAGTLELRVNGRSEAGFDDISTELLLGHLPQLFDRNVESVLVIGFGSGVTAGAILKHESTVIDVVELEAAVLEASELFAPVNGRPLASERVRSIVDDGRTILSTTRSGYDVISSQPSSPWVSGTANLFTKEFFAAARKALRPGGTLIQWFGLFAMDAEALASTVAAMRSEFPYVYGFLENSRATDLLLLGTDRALTVSDLPRWEELGTAVRADLGLIGLNSTTDLWSLLHVTAEDATELAGQATAMNTDDSMYVELHSPWLLYTSPLEPLETLSSLPGTALDVAEADGAPLSPDATGSLAFAFATGRGQPAIARRLVREARRRGPSPH
ncbi:MAG: fused MFS/spermidine synthase, partial [Acidobacteriota bacterium]|nr:fused MFS/spermidine synthase [Acidobacteriota bacterium]